jgi:hypothetical protein
MKTLLLICLLLSGCSTVQKATIDAHNEFKREVNGFKSEFSRVFLKKEVNEQNL